MLSIDEGAETELNDDSVGTPAMSRNSTQMHHHPMSAPPALHQLDYGEVFWVDSGDDSGDSETALDDLMLELNEPTAGCTDA
mmetsp:Transcript_26321/g.69166  ORF Transcript_26321/g.69166 Transcript_26321/m.69166 type:complete len:82 (+) Transcript_26321:3-248(+)